MKTYKSSPFLSQSSSVWSQRSTRLFNTRGIGLIPGVFQEGRRKRYVRVRGYPGRAPGCYREHRRLLCNSPFLVRFPLFWQCYSQLGPCPSPRPLLSAENSCFFPDGWKAPRSPLGSQAVHTVSAISLSPGGLTHGIFSPDNLWPPQNKGFITLSSSSALWELTAIPASACFPSSLRGLPSSADQLSSTGFPWLFLIFEHLRSHPLSQIPKLSKIRFSNSYAHPPLLRHFFLRVPDNPGVGEVAHGRLSDRSESPPQLPSLGGPGGSVLWVPSLRSSLAVPLPVWISRFSNQAATTRFHPRSSLPWQMFRSKLCLPLPNIL